MSLIHERGFYRYLCDNDSAKKNGKTQPPKYRGIKDSHSP